MGKYLHPQDNLLGLQRTDPWTQWCMIQRGWTPWSVCEAGTQNCQHIPNTKLFEGHLMSVKSTHFVVEVGVMFNGIEGRTHKAQLHPHFWTHLWSGESWEFQCVTMQLSCYQEGVRSKHKLPCLPQCCIEYPYLNCNVNIFFERTCLWWLSKTYSGILLSLIPSLSRKKILSVGLC